jgi:hypothetical protein
MSKYTKVEVGIILEDELRRCRVAYTKATEELDRVTNQPSGIPHPARALHAKNAGKSQALALHAYTKALREQDRFINNEEIPFRFAE